MSRVASSSATGKAANFNGEVRVKTERYKGKQKARVEEESQDEDADEDIYRGEEAEHEGDQDADGEVDEEAGPSRGTKRTRVNEEGDSRPGEQDKPAPRMKTLPRDKGYIPGSIVRIQLKNFVTYDSVEFSVGPYLNMILGPNGTGKSSIACAICLGLNFPPSILGRAADLNSFVKIGKEEGHIEIELKGRQGQPNLVIRRHLKATSKQSHFTLNGVGATGAEIKNKMADLNVQDKVSEFAQMSPQELLRETQRAAGDERLTKWHDTLINDGKQLKALVQNLEDESKQLRQMQERNEGIERDVQRYRERKNIEAMIELLQVLIPVEHYRVVRAKYFELKAIQRKLHEKVKRLKAKNEPAHALLKKLDAEHKEAERTRDDFKETAKAKFKKMKNKWTTSDQLERDAEDVTSQLDRLKKEEKDCLKRISSTETEIQRTEAELIKLSEVKLEKHEDLQAEAKQIVLERGGVNERKIEVEEKMKSTIDNKARSNAQLQNAQQDLQRLEDMGNVKMQNLQRWDKNTHAAVLWLRSHKHLFQMEVFEPAVLSVSVPNKQFVNAVEAGINGMQFRTFVCQCQEDSNTFNEHVNDKQVLGKGVRVATWFRPPSQLKMPPMSREEMTELGFDGYLLDYIECPDGMRWWLQCELNFHRTAVSLGGVDTARAMDLVARLDTGGGASFISKTTMNIVSRSQYGQRSANNMTREIKPARNLANVTVDLQEKQRINERINELKNEVMNYEQEQGTLQNELKAVFDEDKVFMARLAAVKRRREKVIEAEANKVKVEAKLDRNRRTLESLRNQPSAEGRRVQLKQKLLSITKKRMQIAKEYTSLARSVIGEQTEATRMGIRFLQIGANRTALQELCNKKDDKYNAALAEFNTVNEQYMLYKGLSKDALEESREIIRNLDGDLKEQYEAIEGKRFRYEADLKAAEANDTTPPSSEDVDLRSEEELQTELETQQANLELNMNTNPGVVEQYEKRKRDIEDLERTIEKKQRDAEKIEDRIKSAKDKWQPALEKLVTSIGEKFSASFDRIGCAGEVRISQHEDYEKWAIDILVKFRDTEKLQLLTGQRQSGGERSLTTILYLLSLTEEARAPFSLVDEINQGMDQRAERSVHNSMVQVTCKEDSAQYFLITPKLLPDLIYHDRMKILCVNNGEWLPEENDLGNMMKMIDGFVGRT
ncbi:hypothetical protein H0H87_007540 [Tephrocybe sp. NHM501043]|nr:hypothetical protein H0H87_007540 [Tephrocybe sp. NHM501043]